MGPAGRLAAAALILLVLPGRAAAEWHFTPLVGYTFKGATTLADLEAATSTTHWNFGGAATLIGEGPLAIEGLYIHTPGFFERDESELAAINLPASITESRTYALMGHAVLTIPRSWNRYGLRPYVSGGLGLIHVRSQDLQDNVPIRLNLLGMSAGGGAIGFLTDRVGLRFDLRYFRNIRGVNLEELEFEPTLPVGAPVRLRYWTGMVGVVIRY